MGGKARTELETSLDIGSVSVGFLLSWGCLPCSDGDRFHVCLPIPAVVVTTLLQDEMRAALPTPNRAEKGELMQILPRCL